MKDDSMDDETLADRRVHGLLLAMEETRSTSDSFAAKVVAAWSLEGGGTPARDRQKTRRKMPWFIGTVGALAAGAAFAFVLRRGPSPERQAQPLTSDHLTKTPATGPVVTAPPPAFSAASPDHKPSPRALEQTVFFLDFEDGEAPPFLISGAVVPGPPREGSRFCVLAGVNEWALRTNTIMLKAAANAVFTYDRRRILRFAYWIGPGASQITVQTRNGDRHLNYNFTFQPRVRGAWAQAVIPFSSLDPFDKATPMQDGDTLTDLFIVGGPIGATPLFVDDIQLVDPP